MAPVIEHPAATPSDPWDATTASRIIAAHATMEGSGLPILHALQEEFGYVPKQAEPLIADALNLSRAEVHGLISFYHDFRRAPPGRHVLKICRAEACQATGGVAMAERLLARLGIGWSGTTADGSLTVDPVYCLGLCGCGPAALLDDEPVARLDDALLAEITADCTRESAAA
jgi:formate dehydrogenase subunit gamma